MPYPFKGLTRRDIIRVLAETEHARWIRHRTRAGAPRSKLGSKITRHDVERAIDSLNVIAKLGILKTHFLRADQLSVTDLQRRHAGISEACKLTGAARRTMYNWLRDGKVEYFRRAGGPIRIFVDTLGIKPGQKLGETDV